jgi:hypothetical protein
MSEKTYFGRLMDEKEKVGHKLISYKISKIAYSQVLILRKSQEVREMK